MKRTVLSTLLALSLSSAAYATPITYDVNRTIGAGTVIGTVETDGTIGALLSTNILNWSLTLTSSGLAGGSPDTISGTSATLILGSGLIGSLTDLVFNFSDSSSAFVLRGADLNGWCLISSSFLCAGTAGPSEGIFFGTSGGIAEFATRSGRVVIAAASTVPEPSTLALLGIGLAGVAFSRRRSKA